jgi:alanine dehydrogenase
MLIGVPRELKDHETRVGLVPSGVRELTARGHRVLIESGAGESSSIGDTDYRDAGAELVGDADDLWARAQMVVKVKEPIAEEFHRFRPGLLLFCYLHLAPLPELTRQLLDHNVTSIGYETVRGPDGSLPLLEPMSEVAGRMSVQVGAQYLERPNGGRGILLGGVPGVPPARVIIIGGGIVGTNAAKVALGMGATVIVLEKSTQRMRQLDDLFGGRVITLASNRDNIAAAVRNTDLLIGAVLIPGGSAPKLVTREMVSTMKRGAVIVDVAIDQGGCVETARPTSHTDPAYTVDGVVHYCVTNMPAAVPRTSTFALTNATFPYVLRLADKGFTSAVMSDRGTAEGVNTFRGHITHPAVASAQNLRHADLTPLVQ